VGPCSTLPPSAFCRAFVQQCYNGPWLAGSCASAIILPALLTQASLRCRSSLQCPQSSSSAQSMPLRPLQGGVWQQLWAAAPVLPASRQRPLFDPVLEGERALHFLETLPPALLFGDLLAAGLSAAVGLLGKAEAASLPAMAREIHRWAPGSSKL
jgi:hypothetical protein